MPMTFSFPGGLRVDAHVGPHLIPTDQPPDATAPSPFALFLASIGACASYYVLEFCRARGIATDGLRVTQHAEKDSTGMVRHVAIEVELPEGFPARYRPAVLRAADQCTVKKHLADPPTVSISAEMVAAAGAA